MSEEKKRRRIQVGLLLGYLEDEFDASVCAGAMEAAAERDVNLVVLPGRYIKGVYKDQLGSAYEYQYHTLFDIPLYTKFDVLLVLVGTIGGHISKEGQTEFLKRYEGTPVITITGEIEGYPSLVIDNNMGMGEAIRHLIDVHGCKNIGFVSGPITNDDARDRLAVYTSVLAEYGIDYDPKKVAYGNFSRYVEREVEELLDRNNDLDAIVFANDQMAYAGYKVFEKRNITPGKDIMVTGFDDDPVCMELSPHLTTVKADSRELGYQAVVEAVNLTLEGEMDRSIISSHLVVRDSCGCTNHHSEEQQLWNSIESDPRRISEYLGSYLFGTDHFNRHQKELCYRSVSTMDMMPLRDILQNESQMTGTLMKYILRWIREGRISSERFYTVLGILHSRCYKKAQNVREIERVNNMFATFFRDVAEANERIGIEKEKENSRIALETNAIAKDMVVFDTIDDRSYFTVVDKLVKMGMKSSYLFAYEDTMKYAEGEKWSYPDKLLLKAFSNSDGAFQVPGMNQYIDFSELFTHRYMDSDKRFTLIVNALFTNEEQYGLLLCEIEPEKFSVLQAVSYQIGAALKIISLVNRQEMIEKQLRASLIEVRENNQLLSELSKIDELTGVFNRRGLYEGVRRKLNATQNQEQHAFMIFADLDSLKIINDRFGHEEGDFAIRSAASILKNVLGEDSVIGRLGGDEFAACILPDEAMTVKRMKELLEDGMDAYNSEFTVDKEYVIHLSVGVYAFKCSGAVEIGELLSHADMLLYEQKRRKKPILKVELAKLPKDTGEMS